MENWRRFNFFDKINISLDDQIRDKLEFANFTCFASGKKSAIFGDNAGNIHFLTPNLELKIVKLYSSNVLLLYHLNKQHLFISIGENDNGNALLKVLNLAKGINKYGQLNCLKTIKLPPNLSSKCSINCISVCHNLSVIAIGLANGQILAYKGNLYKEDKIPNRFKLFFQATSPITNMAFDCSFSYAQEFKFPPPKNDLSYPTKVLEENTNQHTSNPASQQNKKWAKYPKTILYATTTDNIYSFSIEDRHIPSIFTDRGNDIVSNFPNLIKCVVLEELKGCEIGCATLLPKSLMQTTSQNGNLHRTHKEFLSTEDQGGTRVESKMSSKELFESYFVVARMEALYFYTCDGLGPCLAFQGPKIALIHIPNTNYLAVVDVKSNKENLNQSNSSFYVDFESRSTPVLTIYDIVNKFIAFSSPLPGFHHLFTQNFQIHLDISRSSPSDGKLKNVLRTSSIQPSIAPIYMNTVATSTNKFLILITSETSNTDQGSKIGISQSSNLNNSLILLTEHALEDQLKTFFSKNLYDLAISLAKSYLQTIQTFSHSNPAAGNLDNDASIAISETLLIDIYKMYGDYLYDKNDFESAIHQFEKTIAFRLITRNSCNLYFKSYLEPSYVVKRYLKTNHLLRLLCRYLKMYLCLYLERVLKFITSPPRHLGHHKDLLVVLSTKPDYHHDQEQKGNRNTLFVDSEETHEMMDLLINSYLKMGDPSGLDKFLQRFLTLYTYIAHYGKNPSTSSNLLHTLANALATKPDSFYRQKALDIASMYGLTDIYLKIEVEDNKNYDSAIAYIKNMIPDMVGKVKDSSPNNQSSGAELLKCINTYWTQLFLSRPEKMIQILIKIYITYQDDIDPLSFLPLFYPNVIKKHAGGADTNSNSVSQSPDEYFTTFLEGVLRIEDIQSSAVNSDNKLSHQTDRSSNVMPYGSRLELYNLLLDAYISDLAHQVDKCSFDRQKQKVKKLLNVMRLLGEAESSSSSPTDEARRYESPFIFNQALVICHRHMRKVSSVHQNLSPNHKPNLDHPEYWQTGLEFKNFLTKTVSWMISLSLLSFENEDPGKKDNKLQQAETSGDSTKDWKKYLSKTLGKTTDIENNDVDDDKASAKDLESRICTLMRSNYFVTKEVPFLEAMRFLKTTTNGNLAYNVFKEYVVTIFGRLHDQSNSIKGTIATMNEKIAKNESIIENLSNKPQTYKGVKCCGCGHALDTPSIYFPCQHAFHLNCYETCLATPSHPFSGNLSYSYSRQGFPSGMSPRPTPDLDEVSHISVGINSGMQNLLRPKNIGTIGSTDLPVTSIPAREQPYNVELYNSWTMNRFLDSQPTQSELRQNEVNESDFCPMCESYEMERRKFRAKQMAISQNNQRTENNARTIPNYFCSDIFQRISKHLTEDFFENDSGETSNQPFKDEPLLLKEQIHINPSTNPFDA